MKVVFVLIDRVEVSVGGESAEVVSNTVHHMRQALSVQKKSLWASNKIINAIPAQLVNCIYRILALNHIKGLGKHFLQFFFFA